MIVRLYDGDRTRVYREGKDMGEVTVSNGIRQGCTGSPQIFIMMISMIIEEILNRNIGYMSGFVRVPVLFYADDGLLLARDRTEALQMIEMIEDVSRQYGLELNKDKSCCMIFNGRGEGDELGGIKLVNST